MLDEAHERTLYTDIIVGLLKKVCKGCQYMGEGVILNTSTKLSWLVWLLHYPGENSMFSISIAVTVSDTQKHMQCATVSTQEMNTCGFRRYILLKTINYDD